jgi:hypothetical protein
MFAGAVSRNPPGDRCRRRIAFLPQPLEQKVRGYAIRL